MALPVPVPGKWTRDTFECCSPPGGVCTCLYYNYCLPCALSGVVSEVVHQDPRSAQQLNGCCGNPLATALGMYCIPFAGPLMSFFYMCGTTQALYQKLSPRDGPPVNPFLACCCTGLVLQQVNSEIVCRRAAGQPILQNEPPVMMMPGMVMVSPPVQMAPMPSA